MQRVGESGAAQLVYCPSFDRSSADADDMNDIALLTATEMSRCYRDKVLTPLDVVQAVYTRIDALNAVLTAYVALDREAALRAAAQATEELSRRDAEDLPLLHGIPVSIKDVTAVKELPLTHGSPLH